MRGAQVIRFLLIVLVAAAAAPLNAQEAPVEFEPTLESLRDLRVPRVVSRREVWHLRPLGRVLGRRVRRVVRPRDVRGGRRRVPPPCGDVGASLEVWVQGPHSAVEGREVRRGRLARAVQGGGRQVLHAVRDPPRRLLPWPHAVLRRSTPSSMGPKKDLLGHDARGDAATWAAVGRHHALRPHAVVDSAGPRRRPRGSARRRALRRRRPEVPGPVPAQVLRRQPRRHRESARSGGANTACCGTRRSSRSTSPTSTTSTAPCPSPARTTAARGCGCSPISTTPT